MKRKIFIAIALFLTPLFASAKTIIDTDIVNDTIWTKSMSPIILTRKSEEKDRTFRIVNWAHLTIEKWVVILMDKWMDFQVTSECLKWHRWDCFLDTNWKKKMPKLVIKWTKNEPVVIKWNLKKQIRWFWGNMIFSSEWNEIKYTIFEWWWKNPESYFVNLSRWNIFEHNTIKNIWNNAVLLKTPNFKNNIINWANWQWIICNYHTCNIENSVIANTKWIWITITPEKSVLVKNNLIYNNEWIWVKLTKYFEKPAVFENNFFLQNWGGLSLYHNNSSISIKNNNFIWNKYYALFTETSSLKNTPKISWNFYNIDLWPLSKDWEFFVSDNLRKIIWKNFSKNEINFSFEKDSEMQKFLKKINISKDWLKNFLEIHSNKNIFLWDWKFQGSIFSYSFNFKNLETKTLQNASIEIEIPKGQELFICSIKTWNWNYNFKNLCDKNSWEKEKFKDWKIIFPIWKFLPFAQKQIYFTVFKKDNLTAKQPKIYFYEWWKKREIHYALWKVSKDKKYIENKKIAPVITKKSTKKSSSKSFSREDLIAKKIAMAREKAKAKKESENLKPQTNKTSNKPNFIETWTIFTKVYNWKLFFYLNSEEWKTFKLLGSAKWWGLLDFIKSADKNKPVRVYWTYYYWKNWEKKGVFLTHFHLK